MVDFFVKFMAVFIFIYFMAIFLVIFINMLVFVLGYLSTKKEGPNGVNYYFIFFCS